MKIGYIRVSTEDQDTQRQIEGLKYLCDEYYAEKLSALARKRPVYKSVISKLKSGDTFVLWEASRGYRNVMDALRETEKLRKRGIILQIGSMPYDLNIPEMELAFIIQVAAAQSEVKRLGIRTRDGMQKKKQKTGKHMGRVGNETLRSAHAAIAAGEETLASIAAKIGCTEKTLIKGWIRLGLNP